MKAIAAVKTDSQQPIAQLESIEVDTPVASGYDILVKVAAVSVNPVDYKVRQGAGEEPVILGYDASGEVMSVGESVTNIKKGDWVYYAGDVTRSGSNAEYQLVDARIAAVKPTSISAAESAALPLTALTAWEAIFDRLNITKDEKSTLLIIGGAGGVGSIAIQLLKALTSVTVIATASRPESQAQCKALGADYVIDWKDIPSEIEKLGLKNVDYIFNCNDMDQHWQAMGEVLIPQGKICSIVENAHPLPMGMLKRKSAVLVWEFMFTRSMFTTDDIEVQGQILQEIARLIDDGNIKATASTTLKGLTVANIHEAHEQIKSGKTIGKWVIEY